MTESSSSFRVEGMPVPQPRERSGMDWSRGRSRVYLPTEHPVHAWRELVAMSALHQVGRPMHRGALELELLFLFPRVARMPKRLGDGRAWKATKPDCSNLAKAVEDALQRITWSDDAQVARLVVERQFAAVDEPAGLFAGVRELG